MRRVRLDDGQSLLLTAKRSKRAIIPAKVRMTVPKPKQVFDNPGAHWAFITMAEDAEFEGQHFERKEAGRPETDGTVRNAKLRNVREQLEECISAFANATGGLLVLGVSSNGMVTGLKHLSEDQINSLLKLERLVHHSSQIGCQS